MLIAQLTDLHVRPLGLPACRVVETNMLAQRALRAVARLDPAPDVLMITGDLTECGLEAEYHLAAAMLAQEIRIPVFAIPGNHDRREVMITHLPGTRHEDGFVQYAVEDYPVRLVMLDSVVPGAGHGELCARRLDWLERTLAARPAAPTVIGIHHPPFRCGIRNMDAINLHDHDAFAAVLQRHPQVMLVACGHHHRGITARLGQAIVCAAPAVVQQSELDFRPGAPAMFVMEPAMFQLHRWTPEDGLTSHLGFVESFPGPFPYLLDPDYPGIDEATRQRLMAAHRGV
ncbi:MAG TPA: phosphodiesterase [Acetobacteraceae bacterium]|nr:phosphodiesterase [Acetobacteraceae bacterium]